MCGWYLKKFDAVVTKTEAGERNPLRCSNCFKIVRSSVKESTGNIAGKKHIHRELIKGDYV